MVRNQWWLVNKDNAHLDIDPLGEEIWEDEPLCGFAHLESIRGTYIDIDVIIDKFCRERDELQAWFAMPWWKRIFNRPKGCFRSIF